MTSKTNEEIAREIEGKLLYSNGELHAVHAEHNRRIIRDALHAESAARQDTERLATCDGIPVEEVISGLTDLRVHFRKKGMAISEKVIDCAIELLAARCGLDEGEQKKQDLGVTEPVADFAHVLHNIRELITFERTGAENPMCARCNSPVEVEDREWDDGDICHDCAGDMLGQIKKLLSEHSNAACAPPLTPDPVSVQERSESGERKNIKI